MSEGEAEVQEKLDVASAATNGDDDESVIDAAIAGDVHAFATLYDRHLDRIYRHVYYRVGNRADAEDLTQQVFLQAWRSIGRYRRLGAPFAAWLFTIAHNVLVSSRRKVKDLQPLDTELISLARWANPEAEALAEYDRRATREAILRLNPEQQQVIVLRFVENFEYSVIAAVLGKSEGNIRVIQHRALRELRRLLTHKVRV